MTVAKQSSPWEDADSWIDGHTWSQTIIGSSHIESGSVTHLAVSVIQVDQNKYPAIQCNAAKT